MKKIILMLVMIIVLAGVVSAECVDLGDGTDGALIVTSANTIINMYTQITSTTVLSGSTSFDVNDASAFSVGDEILVIQMQHSSNAGTYEFADVTAIDGNTITVSTGLTNNYYSGTFNTQSASASQIVRVPQYTDVSVNSGASITASAWNGYTGGIVVFRATKALNITGSLDVAGIGYRGGVSNGGDNDGYPGESYNGIPNLISTSANNGAGGGANKAPGSGGDGAGGAGYGTTGENGDEGSHVGGAPGVSGRGGSYYGQNDLSKIYFGSGGGSPACTIDSGGDGEGIIIIFANKISNNNIIIAEGSDGRKGCWSGGDGGGGAGGSIYLISDDIVNSGTISAQKGLGYCGNYGCGGNGGDGRIRLDYNSLSGTTNPSHGYQLSNITICTPAIIPTYTNFIPSAETTNFSEETNLTAVTNLTLAITGKGKIRFGQYEINAESTDFDNHVKIENSVISVNTSALHSTFNNSATLTFNNINCNTPYVYYSNTANTRAAILTENKLCLPPRCTNIQCTGSTLTVDVAHFSGYAVNGTANLTIDADDPKYTEQLVTFTAEYLNATDPITGATCNISFSDGSYIMDEQASYYNYSRTFASAQIVDYNVTCRATGENTVFANDTAVINSPDIPEFSTITLGLGLIAILAGLFIIRKKR
ncbi:MAG: hypothetical protein KAI26_02815 [Nanoarchaeota archaeon]|nr:hypothetical protein [Nanoarchaeota archaeon]